MRLNLIAYAWRPFDGYGRYALSLGRALRAAGVDVNAVISEMLQAPEWLQYEWGCFLGHRFALSVMPPFYLRSTPGDAPHWLLSMTEGDRLPPGWSEIINRSNVSRVIVPCEHNARVFRYGGVECPVSVVPGGTEPADFPIIQTRPDRPYTFLTIADRGARKGWTEVWQAFYQAFGTPSDTPDVRLIIKSRPDGNEFLELIAGAQNPDPRITIMFEDYQNMADFYVLGDCLALPSRSEGWGMPHRECAMMGLPVILQRHAGLDDGHTHEWAIVVEGGRMEPIPASHQQIAGSWMKADITALAEAMSWCYNNPAAAKIKGLAGAAWLREHQTWDHSAKLLIDLITQEGAWR